MMASSETLLKASVLAGQESIVQLLLSPKYHQLTFNEDHRLQAITTNNSATEGGHIEIIRHIIERSSSSTDTYNRQPTSYILAPYMVTLQS